MIYGTAWKEDRTEALVLQALEAGFRAIDTANQRKHYFEAAVGRAVQKCMAAERSELFIQSKFTHRDGQDHRLPYDAKAAVAEQVRQSFQSTLEHFATDYLDSYLLHGPSVRTGLAPQDLEAWGAMEELHAAKKTRAIGVSNVSLAQLELLCTKAKVKPSAVQNRCYAARGWDKDVRTFCVKNGIAYQGFSLLTANTNVLHHATVRQIAGRLGVTPPQLIFRFAKALGMTPLTGTTSPVHMKEDLASEAIALTEQVVQTIEALA